MNVHYEKKPAMTFIGYHTEIRPNEGQKYRANGTATLEVYSADNPQSPDYECGIWVPIKGEKE